MIEISTQERTKADVLRAMRAMMLPPKVRKRLLENIGREVVKRSRANARKQRTPDGRRWEKRRNRSRRGKMQKNLARFVTVTSVNSQHVAVSWKKAASAKVAYIHHHGVTQTYTRAQAVKALK
ncbi:phage virion morphogenesis protein [Salinivibrio kushneri]|uniref:Phage virion morphogenesis protein n=1 Tax=Salinivibrio kushneri TaxID=1908198 RepID=A0AB36KA37_9GAMM|nr:phage virion morphogenesis protein [Salinivibrio kushneri]OOE45117.1 phage virion morphogenesis protein [Salinivibrio kushneri]